jgi:hypothetical protein
MKVADQHRFSAVTVHLHSGESRVTTPSVLIALTLLPRSGLVQYLFRACPCRKSNPGHTYALSRAIAHAATKRELVAKQRPPGWTPPGMFQLPEVLTEAEVIEAEAELKALQRHALAVVDPEAKF